MPQIFGTGTWALTIGNGRDASNELLMFVFPFGSFVDLECIQFFIVDPHHFDRVVFLFAFLQFADY